MDNNKKSDKMPNGIIYYDNRLLMEIAPKIYCALIARGFNYDDKEQLSQFAVEQAKILINEIYKNRFNADD